MNSAYIVVFCTTPDIETSEKIASAVVESRNAACVTIIEKAFSVYRWKGEICRDNETALMIKTEAHLFSPLEKQIKSLHPYETPEIIALPITAGSEEYLKWIGESVQQ